MIFSVDFDDEGLRQRSTMHTDHINAPHDKHRELSGTEA